MAIYPKLTLLNYLENIYTAVSGGEIGRSRSSSRQMRFLSGEVRAN